MHYGNIYFTKEKKWRKMLNFHEDFKHYRELFKIPPAHSLSIKILNIFYTSLIYIYK